MVKVIKGGKVVTLPDDPIMVDRYLMKGYHKINPENGEVEYNPDNVEELKARIRELEDKLHALETKKRGRKSKDTDEVSESE